MENTQRDSADMRGPTVPSPIGSHVAEVHSARARPRWMPRLSTARATVLDHLTDQPVPCRVSSLAALLAQHPNTVREHLDGLVTLGLVTREAAEPDGRGRPAWLYSAVHRAPEHLSRPEGRAQAALASALAAHIARTSKTPLADAETAGELWGRELVAATAERAEDARHAAKTGPLLPSRRGGGARRKVVQMLDDLGFAPDANDRATDVRLRHCPLLEMAHQYPEVVCGVHLGLVRGALGALGADPERTSLEPFSEPGVCRLRLLTPPKH